MKRYKQKADLNTQMNCTEKNRNLSAYGVWRCKIRTMDRSENPVVWGVGGWNNSSISHMDTYLKNHTGNMYTFVLLAFSGTLFCTPTYLSITSLNTMKIDVKKKYFLPFSSGVLLIFISACLDCQASTKGVVRSLGNLVRSLRLCYSRCECGMKRGFSAVCFW